MARLTPPHLPPSIALGEDDSLRRLQFRLWQVFITTLTFIAQQLMPGDVAVTILENTIAATSSTMARDRGHLTSKLAVAITRTPQPDPARAASLGLQALSIARDTGSARIMRESANAPAMAGR